MTLDPELLAILACPSCKASVKQQAETLICQNSGCGLQYPIRDGIPVMLIEEAGRPGDPGKRHSH